MIVKELHRNGIKGLFGNESKVTAMIIRRRKRVFEMFAFRIKGYRTETYFHINAWPLDHIGFKRDPKVQYTLSINEETRREYERYKA